MVRCLNYKVTLKPVLMNAFSRNNKQVFSLNIGYLIIIKLIFRLKGQVTATLDRFFEE